MSVLHILNPRPVPVLFFSACSSSFPKFINSLGKFSFKIPCPVSLILISNFTYFSYITPAKSKSSELPFLVSRPCPNLFLKRFLMLLAFLPFYAYSYCLISGSALFFSYVAVTSYLDSSTTFAVGVRDDVVSASFWLQMLWVSSILVSTVIRPEVGVNLMALERKFRRICK